MTRAIFFVFLIFAGSCKTTPDSSRNYDKYDPAKTYKIQLNPSEGAIYRYDITNETEMSLEVDGKKVGNTNKSNIGISYTIDKDSLGNFLFRVRFDTIHLYSKSNGIEKEMDAANSSFSIDPIEKVLGIIRQSEIETRINSKGEVMDTKGYDEIGNKILAAFPETDQATRAAIINQWSQTLGESLLAENLDQLFKIFPDSAVHLNDTWNLTTKQKGEFNLDIFNGFTLKSINTEIALIQSEGKIKTSNSAVGMFGFSNAVANLNGEQEGEFEMETKTGMLHSCKIKADISGNIQAMGRDIPVSITHRLKMKGKKIN